MFLVITFSIEQKLRISVKITKLYEILADDKTILKPFGSNSSSLRLDTAHKGEYKTFFIVNSTKNLVLPVFKIYNKNISSVTDLLTFISTFSTTPDYLYIEDYINNIINNSNNH